MRGMAARNKADCRGDRHELSRLQRLPRFTPALTGSLPLPERGYDTARAINAKHSISLRMRVGILSHLLSAQPREEPGTLQFHCVFGLIFTVRGPSHCHATA